MKDIKDWYDFDMLGIIIKVLDSDDASTTIKFNTSQTVFNFTSETLLCSESDDEDACKQFLSNYMNGSDSYTFQLYYALYKKNETTSELELD